MKLLPRILLAVFAAQPALAAEVRLAPGAGVLAAAISRAAPADTLILTPGRYDGPVVIDRPLTLHGEPGAIVDGDGKGSVLTLSAPDVTITGLTIQHSGGAGQTLDSGVRILKGADRARIVGNQLTDNLHGVDIHGGQDALVSENRIIGRQNPHMVDRGNGIYVWNSPGAIVEKNDIRFGRDGILPIHRVRTSFATTSFATCALPSITCTPAIPRLRATSRSAITLALPSCIRTMCGPTTTCRWATAATG